MSTTNETANWFVVDHVSEVVDNTGTTIGRLRPGQRYRATEVAERYVRVPGPNGTSGFVRRGDAQLIDTEAARPSSHTVEPDHATVETAPSGERESTPPVSAEPSTDGPPPPPSVPAGWMPDPENPEVFIRYWDGDGWSDHRAPAPPGGLSTPAATTTIDADRAAGVGRHNVARTVGAVVAVWTTAAVVRVAYIANQWGDGLGYGYNEDSSFWWLTTAPWSLFFGSVAQDMASWFAPGDKVLFSPLWIFTAIVGVVGVLILLSPKRVTRWFAIVLMFFHVVATSVIGVNPDIWGESLRVVITAAVIPIGVIIALVVSMRAPKHEAAAPQRDQMVPDPPPG